MNIVQIPTEDTYPNPRHYREVRPAAVELLARSIEVVGQLEPIRVWRDGNIYIVDAGHHRLEAAKLLGLATIDAVIAEPDDCAMVGSNLHAPESDIEKSRGTQLLFATGVTPDKAAAVVGADTNLVAKAYQGFGIVRDEVASEDMSLDRLAAITEYADDLDMLDALANASEKDWRAIVREARRPEPAAKPEQRFIALKSAARDSLYLVLRVEDSYPVASLIPTLDQAQRVAAIYEEQGVTL